MTGLNLKGQLDIIERQLRSRAPEDIRKAYDNLVSLERRLEKSTPYYEKARLYLMLGVSLTKSVTSLRMKPRGTATQTVIKAMEYLETAYNFSVTSLRTAPAPERADLFQLKCQCAYEWGVAYLILRANDKLDEEVPAPPVKEMGHAYQKTYKDAFKRRLTAPTSF